MNNLKYKFLCLLFWVASGASHAEHHETLTKSEISLTIPGKRSELDISHDYHKTLLTMALKAASPDREVNIAERPFRTDTRVIAEIKKHHLIDVYWLGGDAELEQALQVIPVPTTRGLIGFRKFIVRKETVAALDAVSNLEELGKFTACQGASWPDTRILRQANLRVTTAEKYEDLFKMLAANRCDYFPRGLHDHTKELELRKEQYPGFVSYQNILLHYPFGVFFHVAKDDPELATELEKGMRLLAKNGEIDALMRRHPLTQHIYPLNCSNELQLFSLPNAYMDKDMDTSDKDLWLQPSYFQITAQNN